jgi:beta-phosphoglucomutase
MVIALMHKIEACLFDLDGVLVDTARYHYLAWRRLAQELGFEFTEAQNERLKGVSRVRSLEILLEIGHKQVDQTTFGDLAAKKNAWYVASIAQMTPAEILPGAKEFLGALRAAGIKTALGSASQNAGLILAKIGLVDHFDAIVDGTHTSKAKPDPEVFLLGAQAVGIPAANCCVFEDAAAGVDAAKAAGMKVVGIGRPSILPHADLVIEGLHQMSIERLRGELTT